MWNAKEIQVSALIEAKDLELPRFQRKSTWNAKKDFRLALSFFKGLPLGAIVIKSSGSGTRYLLDGRQRWEALKGLQDPDTVYLWAKAALGIRTGWSSADLIARFDAEIENYFGSDPSDTEEDGEAAEGIEPEEPLEDLPPDDEIPDEEVPASGPDGLRDLLDLLLMVHALRAGSSKLSREFTFHALAVLGPDYAEADDKGKLRVTSQSVWRWIKYKRGATPGPITEDVFLGWIEVIRGLSPPIWPLSQSK